MALAVRWIDEFGIERRYRLGQFALMSKIMPFTFVFVVGGFGPAAGAQTGSNRATYFRRMAERL
jgi:hypothetical protein